MNEAQGNGQSFCPTNRRARELGNLLLWLILLKAKSSLTRAIRLPDRCGQCRADVAQPRQTGKLRSVPLIWQPPPQPPPPGAQIECRDVLLCQSPVWLTSKWRLGLLRGTSGWEEVAEAGIGGGLGLLPRLISPHYPHRGSGTGTWPPECTGS